MLQAWTEADAKIQKGLLLQLPRKWLVGVAAAAAQLPKAEPECKPKDPQSVSVAAPKSPIG